MAGVGVAGIEEDSGADDVVRSGLAWGASGRAAIPPRAREGAGEALGRSDDFMGEAGVQEAAVTSKGGLGLEIGVEGMASYVEACF